MKKLGQVIAASKIEGDQKNTGYFTKLGVLVLVIVQTVLQTMMSPLQQFHANERGSISPYVAYGLMALITLVLAGAFYIFFSGQMTAFENALSSVFSRMITTISG